MTDGPAAESPAQSLARARALAAEVSALLVQGALEPAQALARQALDSLRGPARVPVLLRLGAVHIAAGRLLDGLRTSVEAGDLAKAAGCAADQCDALVQMAAALRGSGDQVGGLALLEQAEGLARASHDHLRLGRVLRQIGVSSSLLGRHHHALSCLGEARELLQAHADAEEQRGAQLSWLNARNREADNPQADAATRQAAAARLLPDWVALARDCDAAGSQRMAAMAWGNHAITLREAGQPQAAADALAALLPRYRQHGMRPNEGLCLSEMGQAALALGRPAQACVHFREAAALLREGGQHGDLIDALEGLSQAEEAGGDAAAALAALRELRQRERQQADEAARQAVVQRELRIELARLTSHWARLASLDPLTGLANRRGLAQWLGTHWARAERGEPMVLLLLDLDHFKQVNDGFGHDTGDAVLQRVAHCLASHARAEDLAVRHGGEEFLLATLGLTQPQALALAQRLRAEVAAQPWSQVAAGLAVTTSIGLAAASEVQDATALLTLADRRLYAAKYAGRNRVVAAG